MSDAGQHLANLLSCAFVPAGCVLCGNLLTQLSEAPVCATCWSEATSQRENCCARCGEDLFEPAAATTPTECRACRLVPPDFVRAVSAGVYEGTMRHAIHALKYERMAPLANHLGARLAAAIEQLATGSPKAMLVVPVPLFRGRMKDRGFNQARMLATVALKALSESRPEWRLELAGEVLVRQRSTQSQAGLSPRQRRQNLRGAFFVSAPETIRGRHVLLIDDIYTTGATARACSRVLVEAGAASVSVATLARAQRRYPVGPKDDRRFIRLGLEAFNATIQHGGVQQSAVQQDSIQ